MMALLNGDLEQERKNVVQSIISCKDPEKKASLVKKFKNFWAKEREEKAAREAVQEQKAERKKAEQEAAERAQPLAARPDSIMADAVALMCASVTTEPQSFHDE